MTEVLGARLPVKGRHWGGCRRCSRPVGQADRQSKGKYRCNPSGTIAGGTAGNEGGKALGSRNAYDYVVKLNNGGTATVNGSDNDNTPQFKVGDKVSN